MSAPHYAIDALRVPGVPVVFLVGDQEAIGFLRYTATGRPVYRLGTLQKSVDLPKHARPSLWRPAGAWPEPLPEPAIETKPVKWAQNGPTSSPPERSVAADHWPFPDVRLGKAGTAPVDTREAMARVLRAIRTFDVRFRDRPPPPSILWPRDLLVEAHVVWKRLYTSRTGRSEHLRQDDYDDIWVDRSELDARPARWDPTRRDIADLEDGNVLRWLDGLTRRQTQILRLRAALPPYSFPQIAEFQDRTENDVRADYARACDEVWGASQRERQETAHR